MALFNKKTADPNLSERDKLEARYKGSRNNILLVVAFSLINTVLLITGSESYFLFSASVPYYLTFFGMLYTGRLPAEYYVDVEDFVPFDNSVFIVFVAIAVIVVGLYALSWYLSKKKTGWMIFALVSFIIDTLAMFGLSGISADAIIDIVFHVWVIVSLSMGISAASKIKKLPPEEQPVMVDANGMPIMNGMPQMTGMSPDLMSGYAPNNNTYYPTSPVEPVAPVVDVPAEAQTTDVTE